MPAGPVLQHTIDSIPGQAAGPVLQHTIDSIPGHASGPIIFNEVEAQFMGIRAKQVAAATFDSTQVTRVFASQSIAGSRLVNGDIDTTQIADGAITAAKIDGSTVAGNGITGGSGSALAVEPNVTDDGGVPGLEAAANGVRIAAAGLGDGLTGGGGTIASVDPDTGIAVTGSGVAVDTTAALSFTGVHTHSPDTLQVVGTPDSANDAINKDYADNIASSIVWKPAVHAKELVGSSSIAGLNGLTPAAGDAYVATDAGTPTAGTSDALVAGSVTEYDGTQWKEIIAGSGGFVPSGIRALASIQTALNGTIGLTDGVDDGKILEWDGTSLTPAEETPAAGDAVLVTDQDADGDSIYANNAYTFQGAVPTGVWTQFTGAGQINAGLGLAKSGNTINVGDVNKGVQANADDLQLDASEVASNGLAQVAGGGNEHLLTVDPDSTTGGNIQPLNVVANGAGLDVNAIAGTGVEADGSANLRLAAQGNGIAGGAGSTLSVDPDSETGGDIQPTNITANGVGLDVNAIAGTGIEADGSANLRLATQGNGITGGAGSTLSVDAYNGISVDANGVAVNPAQLVHDGNAEVDGDTLDISFVPSNYTRDTGPAEVTSVDELTAHLKGVDNALAAAGGTETQEEVTTQNITGTDTALTDTLNNTPNSSVCVKLFLNGILQVQGAGKDYTVSGSTITWLASTGTAVDMDTGDVLVAVYSY